jgi:hypothetical protein
MKRVKASSFDLPEVDELETQKKAAALIALLLADYPSDAVLAALKDSVRLVKSFYTRTHRFLAGAQIIIPGILPSVLQSSMSESSNRRARSIERSISSFFSFETCMPSPSVD